MPNETFYQEAQRVAQLHQAEARAARKVATRLGTLQRRARRTGRINQNDIAKLSEANDEANRAEQAANVAIVALANTYFE